MRTHVLSFDGYGQGFITEVARGRTFDPVGRVGAPLYHADPSGGLVVENARFPGKTSIFWTVTQLSQAFQQHDHDRPARRRIEAPDDVVAVMD